MQFLVVPGLRPFVHIPDTDFSSTIPSPPPTYPPQPLQNLELWPSVIFSTDLVFANLIVRYLSNIGKPMAPFFAAGKDETFYLGGVFSSGCWGIEESTNGKVGRGS